MKYVLIIGDGMADRPLAELQGRTVLQAAVTPVMDRLAKAGRVGLVRTVPNGVPAGSDTAILSIFGCDPLVHYTGRSPLEAAGADVFLHEGEVSLRCNLVSVEGGLPGGVMRSHSGGAVEGDEAVALMQALIADPACAAIMAELSMRFALTRSFRHIAVMKGDAEGLQLTPPHDRLGQDVHRHLPAGGCADALLALMMAAQKVLQNHPVNAARAARGAMPVTGVWFWGAGTLVRLPSFLERFGTGGTVSSAVPLVQGIAKLCGLCAPNIRGANGEIDTNYAGKMEAALCGLAGNDFCAVHVEAPDECGHAGDLKGKIRAVEALDERLLAPMTAELSKRFGAFRMLVLPDHPTPIATRTHDASPVPFLLYDSRLDTKEGRTLDEVSAAAGPLVDPGTKLIAMLLEK